MKRRVLQITMALVAVATLSACIIIQAEREPEFAAAPAPAISAER
jgi:hypothetical protein